LFVYIPSGKGNMWISYKAVEYQQLQWRRKGPMGWHLAFDNYGDDDRHHRHHHWLEATRKFLNSVCEKYGSYLMKYFSFKMNRLAANILNKQ
jgi:hypothetical protein